MIMALHLFVVAFLIGVRAGKDVPFACHPNCNNDEKEHWSTPDIDADLQPLESWDWWEIGSLKLAHLDKLDGGGRVFVTDLHRYILNRLGNRIPKCVEFCAGPGYLAFTMLEAGICDTLVMVEVNPMAIAAMKATVKRNNLHDRVKIIQSNGLDDVPSSEYGQWSLVFSNPPHYFQVVDSNRREYLNREVDVGWNLHRRFYASVGKFLVPRRGHVVFLEDHVGSAPEDFIPMMKGTGLYVAEIRGGRGFWHPNATQWFPKPMWYLHMVNSRNWWRNFPELETAPALSKVEKLPCWVGPVPGGYEYGALKERPDGCQTRQFNWMRDWQKKQRDLGGLMNQRP